jgi:hypothetical protein
MASIFKALWAGLTGNREPPDDPPHDAIEHNGYRIRPAPYAVDGGYQTCGVIERDFPEGMKEHRFVRAETHPTPDAAAAFAIAKGQQIVDEQGERLFADKQ